MKLNKNKVLVGMSGGVDSSAAVGLLLEKGYEVVGITISPFYLKEYVEGKINFNPKGEIEDAKNVCKQFGIEHIVVDYFDYFKTNIIDYFTDEYLSGRTPNPCVKCNPIIKWGKLIQTANEIGANYIATGHYANIEKDEYSRRFFLKKGIDQFKDQSYFLWRLSQKQLARTLFPLGPYRKAEVRDLAKKFGLKIHNKSDSQEICFIQDNDYRNFLRTVIPEIDEKIGAGDIVFKEKVIGKHKGYPYYTIGQRKGLGIIYREPLYVKKIIPEKNVIEVDTSEFLLRNELNANFINLIKYESIDENKIFNVKVRYRDVGTSAKCKVVDKKLIVNFLTKKRAVTPGQSIVIYEDDYLVAGGIIE